MSTSLLTSVGIALALLLPAFAGLMLLGRPMQMLTIARNTFLEAIRQPIYFILIFLCGIFQILTTWSAAYSMGYTESGEVSGDDKVLLDIGMATVFVCGMLLASFIATAVLSREIENKTVLTVVSKPVSRPALVLGKYLGVAGAMAIATGTMVLCLLLGIRHGVMSTSADTLDQPVLTFGLMAAFLALGAGVWCNFFYGWSFTQTTTMLLFPLLFVAYVMVLLFSKKWQFQSLAVDFKPQITLACLSMVLAQLVLTAVATACSARLGQVMTIVVCSGVFFFGLVSNYFIGSKAYSNKFVGKIESVQAHSPNDVKFERAGDAYVVTLEQVPRGHTERGTPFYYGPNPTGYPLSTTNFTVPPGDVNSNDVQFNRKLAPSLAITDFNDRVLTVKRVGGADGVVARYPPKRGDFVFFKPTQINVAALAVWSLVPNVQFFWFVDAITQHQDVPPSHVLLIILYGIAQIGVFLAIAVLLFQSRDVG